MIDDEVQQKNALTIETTTANTSGTANTLQARQQPKQGCDWDYCLAETW